MTLSLELGLDRGGLDIKFSFKTSEGAIPSSLSQWILNSISRPELIGRTEFSISRFDFLESLKSFAYVRQQLGTFPLKVNDQEVVKLIDRFRESEESLGFSRRNPDARIKPEELRGALLEENFLRASSLSEDQLRDIGRMVALKHSANFSVPGAGKTTALLAAHTFEKKRARVDTLLVVSPRNALGSWDQEVLFCFGPEAKVVRLTGGVSRIKSLLAEGPSICTISYQQLRLVVPLLSKFMLKRRTHLVLDEAHRAKGGRSSQQGLAALELAAFAERRDILTGTPMPQGFSDVEAQVSFLWPGLGVVDSTELEARPAEVKEALKPLYVRTRKSELKLPPLSTTYHSVPMDSDQQSVHRILTKKFAKELAGISDQDVWQLRKLGRQIMRQLLFCSDPELFLQSVSQNSDYAAVVAVLSPLTTKETNKHRYVDQMVTRLMQDPLQKCVLWSSFTGVVESLAARFEQYGATFIHGGVETSETKERGSREWVIDQFHSNPDNRILVANPAACGEGISLHHAAQTAIYFDRSFNAGHFLQSVDRIHRRGLPSDAIAQVHILSLDGTIENVVRDRLSQKVKALEQLLDDPDLVAMVYDPEDVVEDSQDSSGLDLDDIRAISSFLKDGHEH